MSPLTSAQKATLKAYILTQSDLLAFYTPGDLSGLAGALNASASPTFTVWKTSVSLTQIGDKINGTELAGLTSLNVSRLQVIAQYSDMGVNPSLADRRQFFDDIFSGAGGATTRAQLLVLWKRAATRFEKIFANGAGSDASPATIVVEGAIDYTELIGL